MSETRAVFSHSFQMDRPVIHTGETLLISDVVNKQDAHSASVVSGGDGSESFLTFKPER